jgi:1,4-alpha-glucan branching enzyme
MGKSLGRLCIVLHGHLPYVLHHGSFPHGEAWLFEAAAETYLPLLDLINEAGISNIQPGLTVGLTPVLLEQLSHPRFRAGFVMYLNQRIERARTDAREFERATDSRSAYRVSSRQGGGKDSSKSSPVPRHMPTFRCC